MNKIISCAERIINKTIDTSKDITYQEIKEMLYYEKIRHADLLFILQKLEDNYITIMEQSLIDRLYEIKSKEDSNFYIRSLCLYIIVDYYTNELKTYWKDF